MNNKKEGEYYYQMVRKYKDEYGGKNLKEFCIKEKVSYSKMLNCLRYDFHHEMNKNQLVPQTSDPGLFPLLVEDFPAAYQTKDHHVSDVPERQLSSPQFPLVELTIRQRIHVKMRDCSVSTLICVLKEMEASLC